MTSRRYLRSFHCRRVTLFRTTSFDDPHLGFESYWSTSEQMARGYAGYGVPGWEHVGLYRIRIRACALLDLRGEDRWSVLRSKTGIDEALIADAVQGHVLLQSRAQQIADAGFRWVAHPSFGSNRHDPTVGASDE